MSDDTKKLRDMVDKRVRQKNERLDEYLSAANRMGHTASSKTGGMLAIEQRFHEIEQQRSKNSAEISKFMSGYQQMPGPTSDVGRAFKKYNEQAKRLDASHDLWKQRYENEQIKREQIARNQFSTQVSSLASYGTSFQSLDPADRARALKQAEQGVKSGAYSEYSVTKGLGRLSGQESRRREDLIAEAQNPQGNINDFMAKAEQLESTKSKLTSLQAAQKVMRSMGLDTESVYSSSKDRVQDVLNKREDLALQSKVFSGQTGSLTAESGKLKDLEDKFIEAQQKFVDALDGPTEQLEEFKKSVLEAGKSLDDQKKLVDEMKKQGVGNRGESALDAAKTIARAGTAAADMYGYATVSADTRQMSQRAQFARVQNQIFMDHYAATQGDMTALATIQSGAANRSAAFGGEQMGQQATATTGGLAAKSVEAGVEILDAIAGGAKGVSKLGSRALKAGKALLQHGPEVVQRGVDFEKNLSVNQAGVEGFQTRYDLSRATNEVKGSAMQEFYNQSMTNFGATQGFGSQRSNTFAQMQASRLDMARLGVSTEEQAAMYQTALASMGSEFTRRGPEGMQALTTQAAKVGISGVTSAQDYLARVGQVSQTGGSDKQVEDILANAVARGVDDAKSFGDMVDSLSQLSGQSAGRGVDVTDVMTKSLLGGLDYTRGNGMNERLNLNAVQSQLQTLNEVTSDSGLTFGAMLEQSQLSQISDLSMAGRASAMQVSGTEAKAIDEAIKSGDIQKAKTMSNRLGIGEMYFDEKGGLRKDAMGRSQQFMKAKSSKIEAELMAITDADTAKRLASGGAKSPEDFALLRTAGFGQEGLAAYNAKDFSKKGMSGLEGDAANAQDIKAAAPTGKARFSGAGEQLGGGLGNIASDLKSIAESLRPVEAAAKAASAAGSMKLDTGSFDKSVESFDIAVQKLIVALGEKGGPKSPNFANSQNQQGVSVEKPVDNRGMTKSQRVVPGR